jgi:excinuclease ABC subunit A
MTTILDTVGELTTKKSSKVMGVALDDTKLALYAPVVVGRKGEYYQLLYDLLGKGYERVRVDGEVKKLREQIILDKNKKHDIDVLMDELYASELADSLEKGKEAGTSAGRERLSEGLERALLESGGLLRIIVTAGKQTLVEKLISSKFMCPYDGFSYPEIEPRLFSFNSPYGACPACNGLGTENFWSDDPCPVCAGTRLREEALHVYLGDAALLKKIDVASSGRKAADALADKNYHPPEGLNIADLISLSIAEASKFFNELTLTPKERTIAKVLLREIEARLQFMIDVGIQYLALNRRATTLSGGEAQRIRLASQLGSGLVGALYVLDEPTIGLHQRDNDRLIKTLLDLRDAGNTILVVEHDEDTIFASDYIIDIGPGAGVHGGKVVVAGYLEELLTAKKNDSKSLTLSYLRGEEKIEIPDERRTENAGKIMIRDANVFNIKHMDVDIPLGKLVMITGVSGSGKSTFMYELVHKNVQARLDRKYRSAETFNCASFVGTEYLGRAVLIDQSAIGRTPRSNPATYTGAWTFIRDLFAAEPEARARGWKANRFSFNVRGGRCEACQGNGEVAVEMSFLPTVYVPCDVCDGKRFMKETLEITYRKKNISDILKMTVEEALEFFQEIPAICDRIKVLNDVGLGYLELGQSATTLSGGEAQRVKISAELYRPHVQKSIYLLDEPTIGLHYEDVRKLIEILQKLVEKGNTVMVIEHNMDLIKSADYIIDIGPEGGVGGGNIVAKGTPEEVANNPKSYTGQYLKKALK